MKKLLTTILLLQATWSFAGLNTRILHISSPETMDEEFEVLVAKENLALRLAPQNLELIEKVQKAHELNSVVDLTIEEDKLIDLVVLDGGDNILDFYPSEEIHPMTNYTPSNVDSYEQAVEMFNSLKDRTKWFTQCFNRAHVWAKQMYNSHQVDSMKILIYYTKKYRREIKGKWWFHIAPLMLMELIMSWIKNLQENL